MSKERLLYLQTIELERVRLNLGFIGEKEKQKDWKLFMRKIPDFQSKVIDTLLTESMSLLYLTTIKRVFIILLERRPLLSDQIATIYYHFRLFFSCKTLQQTTTYLQHLVVLICIEL